MSRFTGRKCVTCLKSNPSTGLVFVIEFGVRYLMCRWCLERELHAREEEKR